MSTLGIIVAVSLAYFFGFCTGAIFNINPCQSEEEAAQDESHAATRYRVSQEQADKSPAGSEDA
jgi:hypothetical protein